MKKTVRNAVLAAMVLTTVCGGAQMAWAEDVDLEGTGLSVVRATVNEEKTAKMRILILQERILFIQS